VPTEALGPMPAPNVVGLVLAGGESRRMGRDKAALEFAGQSQLERTMELLARHLPEVFVSVRDSQRHDPLRARFPQVIDAPAPADSELAGPIAGVLGAFALRPDHAWLVVACDLPLLDDAAVSSLLAGRDPTAVATAYASAHDGLPEPLCAIWEPAAASKLAAHAVGGNRCPRKFLLRNGAALLPARESVSVNVNTPAELAAATDTLAGPSSG
jgi:molybdenum cofactor guanylyltransferase